MNQKNKKQIGWASFIVAICLMLSILLFAQMSQAKSDGSITGFSGASGQDCSLCHAGGITPTVTLAGPDTVFIGDVLTYTLTVAGGQGIAAGLDVAATGGVLTDTLAGSLYTKIVSGEITHENGDATQKASPNYFAYGHDGGPKCINSDCTQVPGGEVVFTFNWIAPATAESVTMFGAGNSVDLSGDNTGDSAGTDTLTINVFDPAIFTETVYLPFVVK